MESKLISQEVTHEVDIQQSAPLLQKKPEGKRVRILTYNLYIRPPPVNTHGSDHKDARLNYFIKEHLPNWDVICFQEVFAAQSDRKYTLIEAAYKVGLRYHATSSTSGYYNNMGSDGGYLTLSRHPIVKSSFH